MDENLDKDNLLDKENFIKHFLEIAPKYCDNCGSKYLDIDYKMIKSTPNGFFIHLRCPNCFNTYALNIVNPSNGILGAQKSVLNLDLSSDSEIDKFAGKSMVSKNDAIDIFGSLRSGVSKKELKKKLQID